MFRFKHNAPKEKFFFKSMMPRNLSLQNKMQDDYDYASESA